MAEPSLFVHTSSQPLSNEQTQDFNHGQQAIIRGEGSIHHYHAIPTAVKGIQSYLALSPFAISTAAHLPLQANNRSQNSTQIGTTSAPASNEKPYPRTTLPRVEFKEDRLPRGTAEDVIAWTDDDIDATDFKNMADYDPSQEESEYNSTPPPETEVVASQTLGGSSPDTSLVRQYVRIYSSVPTSSSEEISGTVTRRSPISL